jgi:hypothetical protein
MRLRAIFEIEFFSFELVSLELARLMGVDAEGHGQKVHVLGCSGLASPKEATSAQLLLKFLLSYC